MRWEVYEDQEGAWRWRAIARNGRVVADGAEGYASERNATRALASFREQVREPDGPSAATTTTAARRCECRTPKISKAVTNLCTGCGLLRR